MKVQCGQCPAKYSVADDRVRDKKVRVHCKRCGASIVVDGRVSPPLVTSTPARRSVRPVPSIAPGQGGAPAPSEPESQPSPRPVAHTILGGLEAPTREQLETVRPDAPTLPPQATGLPAEGRGFTDPPVGASDDRWRVALTKQDLRWMTTEEITEAYHAGAVQLETFVFRVGMPTWVTLLEVPEIARALGADDSAHETNGQPRPSSIPPPRRSPPRRAPRELPAEADADETDTGEPLPFALVSERASSSRRDPAPAEALPRSESDGSAPAGLGAAAARPAEPPTRDEAPEPAPPAPELAPQQPFAANVLSPPSSGATVWVWVLILLAIAIGVAIVLGPRFGFRLF
jgi:predicted Zn finger-like uncharacterized protein